MSILCLYIQKARQFYHGPQEVFQRVVNAFIAAVPTGLATVLIFSLGTCVRKLRNQKIDLLQPEKIKSIADVEVVCFDKTGTLTRSVVSPAELCFPAQQPCTMLWLNTWCLRISGCCWEDCRARVVTIVSR